MIFEALQSELFSLKFYEFEKAKNPGIQPNHMIDCVTETRFEFIF